MSPGTEQVERIILRATGLLFDAADSPSAQAALEAAIAPAVRVARSHSDWPVLALPLRVATALGAGRDQAEDLAAAALVFFASADVIDDAQDGDGDLGPFGGTWAQAVNAGNALIFIALQAASTAAPLAALPMAQAFGRAGLAMALGQRRDLAQRGDLGSPVGEADYMSCIRGKAGGSFRLFSAMGAIATGAGAERCEALGSYGESLGMALQLASDMTDLRAPHSRDAANQVLTLPVLQAWSRLSPAERPLLAAAWQGAPDAPSLAFLLERTGAFSYCRARTAVLTTEAKLALEHGAVPAALRAELEALLGQVALLGESGLV